jgi:hypothetical protein
MKLERRTCELRASSTNGGKTLFGYAAVFNAASEGLPGFVEIVRPGAFERTLSNGADVLALYHHDVRAVLGSTHAKTLTVKEDDRGLYYEVAMPDTTVGRDLLVSVGRGDIRGASFSFEVAEDGEKWTVQGDKVIRELLDLTLYDVTITPTPAYPDTSVARRALERIVKPTIRLALARRYMETV